MAVDLERLAAACVKTAGAVEALGIGGCVDKYVLEQCGRHQGLEVFQDESSYADTLARRRHCKKPDFVQVQAADPGDSKVVLAYSHVTMRCTLEHEIGHLGRQQRLPEVGRATGVDFDIGPQNLTTAAGVLRAELTAPANRHKHLLARPAAYGI